MRRAVAAAMAVAVLGAACTEDRAAVDGKPRCHAQPGRGLEGFVQVRTREFSYRDHIGVRKEFRDQQGRLLVYLLGVVGEIGEGSAEVHDAELVDGTPARFMGGGSSWILVWEEDLPCPQIAVVGNGFDNVAFLRLLTRAQILSPQSVPDIAPVDQTEWVAVFHTATNPNELERDTRELLELVGRSALVGPAGCHHGLPEALGVPPENYVSGVVATSQEGLDAAVKRASRSSSLKDPPLVMAEFEVLCD